MTDAALNVLIAWGIVTSIVGNLTLALLAIEWWKQRREGSPEFNEHGI